VFVFGILMHLFVRYLFASCNRESFGIDNDCWVVQNNQTVNDGVAHSKNPRKCAYHVTFDLDLDLEHTLDAH